MPCTANDIAIALFDNFNEVILEHVNAPINVKPRRGGGGGGGGGSGIGGAFDFLSKFSIKCPTVGQ